MTTETPKDAARECADYLGTLINLLTSAGGSTVTIDADLLDQARGAHARFLAQRGARILPEPTPCRGSKCSRKLLFAIDEEDSEKRLPIDVSTACYLVYRDDDGRVVASRLGGSTHRRVGVLHYATCANPGDFGKGRG